MTGPARYAIYFAPEPDGALWTFGSAVLGYDAATGEDRPFLVPAGWTTQEWAEATREPRRYGFHATLKAPFRLADGTSEAGLEAALAAFGKSRPPPAPVPLVVDLLDTFVALVPARPAPEIAALEAAVLRFFDPFRAPLSPQERARRRPESLTARQLHALDEWGYPHVLDDFRFHMTLTGRLDVSRARGTRDALARIAEARGAAGDVSVDRVGLFRQVTPEARFTLIAAERLTGPATRQALGDC